MAEASASTEYFAYDGLGSVRQVLDAAALPLMAQTFDPYGNPYSYTGPTESVTRYGYSGEQTDSNGLVFLRARYYDPKQGRFFQRDSWRGEPDHPLTLNPYMYGLGNPVLLTDPSGQCAACIAIAIAILSESRFGRGSGSMMAKSTSVCAQIFVAADHLRPFAADSVIH